MHSRERVAETENRTDSGNVEGGAVLGHNDVNTIDMVSEMDAEHTGTDSGTAMLVHGAEVSGAVQQIEDSSVHQISLSPFPPLSPSLSSSLSPSLSLSPSSFSLSHTPSF